MRFLLALLLAALPLAAKTKLLNGKDLTGWEVSGDGLWTVMKDGTVVGQFDYKYAGTRQSWLVSKELYTDFNLSFDFWLPRGTNSGIAVRDATRAKAEKPPSLSGYEIQLIDWPGYEWTTGSVFRFQHAKAETLKSREWNHMDVEVKGSHFKITLNGTVVCEMDDATRPRPGPVEFQLHDKTALLMLRNIEIEKWK
jgi:hypothetical protein